MATTPAPPDAADAVQIAQSLLLPGAVRAQVQAWLSEDVPSGFDVGGFVVGGTYACRVWLGGWVVGRPVGRST